MTKSLKSFFSGYTKSQLIIFTVLVIFSLIPLLSNIKGLLYNCFHAYDLGLYQQAIFNIADGVSLNPYLTIRGLNISNDHFMPILILMAPFVWLFNFDPTSLIWIEWLWYLLFLGMIYFLKRKEGPKIILFSLFMVIFSKGLLTGLEFPVHPAVWSPAVWLLLVYFIYQKNDRGIIFSSIAVCIFRESYPFSIFLLSFYFLVLKRYKLSFILLIFSSLYLIWIFKYRAQFLGPVYDYGGGLVRGMISDPFGLFYQSLMALDFKAIFKIFLPFFIPFFLIIKKTSFKLSNPFWAGVFILVPFFGIHLLTGKFHFHYGAPFIAVFTGMIIFNKNFDELLKKPKRFYFICFLFLITSSSVYTKFFKMVFFGKNSKCVVSTEKSHSLKKLLPLVKKIPDDKVLTATGGIIQQIMRPRLQVYPPHTMVTVPKMVDYLLFEKDSNGDTYPWNAQMVNQAVKNCREYSSDIIYEDQFFFFARGAFPFKCYDVYK